MSLFPPERVGYITGAASGIGRATALQFVRDGLHNVTLVDQNEAGLEETVAELTKIDPTAKTLTVKTDITSEGEVDRSVAETVERFGRIDHCVNAAGVLGAAGSTAETGAADFDRAIDVNMKGVWLCQRAQIRQFLKQEKRPLDTGVPVETVGTIVNVASILGHVGFARPTAYVASKHAVMGMTRSAAIELGTSGIRINAMCPGFVKTPLLPEEVWAMIEAKATQTPVARLGTPEEIAFSICFLSSDRSSFTTGAGMLVDGGWTCQ